MNIIEALKIAKEQGKRVRPVNAKNFYIIYVKSINDFDLRSSISGKFIAPYWTAPTADIFADWEVVKEKPSKETQYKIDSMKFQIVRHCKNTTVNDNTNCTKCIITEICDKTFKKNGETPYNNALDGWRLKEIVEAYHILKEAGDI